MLSLGWKQANVTVLAVSPYPPPYTHSWPREMPVLPAPLTSHAEEKDEVVGLGGLLSPPAPVCQITHSNHPEIPPTESRGEENQVQAEGQAGALPHAALCPAPHPGPSHEVATLGSILVYLALSPRPSVWPTRQLGRSLQSPA